MKEITDLKKDLKEYKNMTITGVVSAVKTRGAMSRCRNLRKHNCFTDGKLFVIDEKLASDVYSKLDKDALSNPTEFFEDDFFKMSAMAENELTIIGGIKEGEESKGCITLSYDTLFLANENHTEKARVEARYIRFSMSKFPDIKWYPASSFTGNTLNNKCLIIGMVEDELKVIISTCGW